MNLVDELTKKFNLTKNVSNLIEKISCNASRKGLQAIESTSDWGGVNINFVYPSHLGINKINENPHLHIYEGVSEKDIVNDWDCSQQLTINNPTDELLDYMRKFHGDIIEVVENKSFWSEIDQEYTPKDYYLIIK